MPDIFIAPTKEKKSQKAKRKKRREIIEKESTGSLASFVPRPDNVRFETQERKEKIILLLRRHVITNVPWMLTTLGMVFLPLVVTKIISFSFIPFNYRLIGLVGWYLLAFAFTFEHFLSWFFNVNILTDERVVDIDFPSVLYRDITSTKTDQIQDVTVRVGGFVRSLFNYGDVLIQTAGTVPEVCFEAVPQPSRVTEVINQLIAEEEKEKLEGRVR
jgi:uncharacterized membrane protein YdbT with pleckstrin-like domain